MVVHLPSDSQYMLCYKNALDFSSFSFISNLYLCVSYTPLTPFYPENGRCLFIKVINFGGKDGNFVPFPSLFLFMLNHESDGEDVVVVVMMFVLIVMRTLQGEARE